MSNGQKLAASVAVAPDPEVTPKAKRRSFSAVYKKKILAEVDAAAGTGQIGVILRREDIYCSTLTGWRRERDPAVHQDLSQKRGPEPKQNPLAAENEKLPRQNQRLAEELRKAEIIVEVQKKWHCCWVARCRRFQAAGTPHGRGRRTQLASRREASLSESFHCSGAGISPNFAAR